MERDRWAGGGIPFLKIGRAVKYRKSDVLAWLEQYQPQNSTSEGVAVWMSYSHAKNALLKWEVTLSVRPNQRPDTKPYVSILP